VSEKWIPREPPPCPKCGTPLVIQMGVGPYHARCFECCPMTQRMIEGDSLDYAGPLGVEYDLRNLKYYQPRSES